MLETELKFKVTNPLKLFNRLNGKGVTPEVCYIKDEIWGKGINAKVMKPKIRIRRKYYADGTFFLSAKETIPQKGVIKTIIEKKVSQKKGFKLENSYDKIRWEYNRFDTKITIDFYSIGVFCEIEGESEKIKKVARKLGLKGNITDNIDQIYTKDCKMRKIPMKLHWGFENQ